MTFYILGTIATICLIIISGICIQHMENAVYVTPKDMSPSLTIGKKYRLHPDGKIYDDWGDLISIDMSKFEIIK